MTRAVVAAVSERRSERRHDAVRFGSRGSAWSTVVDVTLRDAGDGLVLPERLARLLPFVSAPYLDLSIELLVTSPTATRFPPWFVSRTHGLRRLVLEEWDARAVSRWVHGLVDPTGTVDGDALYELLARHFWFDDPSEEQWVDEPHD